MENLTASWRAQYENVFFPLPHQTGVDEIMLDAKRRVVSGNNLQVSKAIPPPRGRPVKNAGKRRKGWYERDPNAPKRRSYAYSFCHLDGHVAQDCSLGKLFDDAQQ